jgi:hypothetical protein
MTLTLVANSTTSNLTITLLLRSRVNSFMATSVMSIPTRRSRVRSKNVSIVSHVSRPTVTSITTPLSVIRVKTLATISQTAGSTYHHLTSSSSTRIATSSIGDSAQEITSRSTSSISPMRRSEDFTISQCIACYVAWSSTCFTESSNIRSDSSSTQ